MRLVAPTAFAVGVAMSLHDRQDWWMFQRAADFGWRAYTYEAKDTGPLTGPLTIGLGAVTPYWLVVTAILALLPVVLWRAGVAPRVALWGGLAVAPMWGSLARWGHIDDAAAVCLLVEARNHQGWRRGLLVGAAVAFKPWAVLGLPLLFGSGAALAAAGAVQVMWLPFLRDVVTMPHPAVVVQPDSPLRLAVGGGTMPDAGWRIGQLAAVVAVAWLCHRRGRLDAALLAAMAVKVALDANDPDYYCAALALAAVLVQTGRWRVVALGVVWVDWLSGYPYSGTPATAGINLGCLVVLVALSVWPSGRAEDSIDGGEVRDVEGGRVGRDGAIRSDSLVGGAYTPVA